MIITLGLISSLRILVIILGYLFRKKVIEDQNFSRTFECGFVTFIKRIIPFSLRFFLVAIIFLIFDVELILLFPFFFSSFNFFRIIIFIFFLLILS
jgi:NADH:ubiquinone oxidoreductase subunit 3 (subunit A)